MDVQIVMLPETKVAAIGHYGSPRSEHETARKLIARKLERKLPDAAAAFADFLAVVPRLDGTSFGCLPALKCRRAASAAHSYKS